MPTSSSGGTASSSPSWRRSSRSIRFESTCSSSWCLLCTVPAAKPTRSTHTAGGPPAAQRARARAGTVAAGAEARILRQDAALDAAARRSPRRTCAELEACRRRSDASSSPPPSPRQRSTLTRGSERPCFLAAGVAIVDASSGCLVAHIGRELHQGPGGGYHGRSLLGLEHRPYEMVQIDPDNGSDRSSDRSLRSARPAAAGIVDGRSLWLGGQLVRMDIPQDKRGRSFRLSETRREDGPQGWRWAHGSFWVTRADAGSCCASDWAHGAGATSLWRPSGRRLAWSSATEPSGVQSGHGVERIDLKTNTTTATAAVPEPELATSQLGGGYLWASNETKGTVYKVDDDSGEIVDTYETGDGAREESYADGTCGWPIEDVGTVTGIDAATGENAFSGSAIRSIGRGAAREAPGRDERRANLRRPDRRARRRRCRLIVLDLPAGERQPSGSAVAPRNLFHLRGERATARCCSAMPDALLLRGQQLVPRPRRDAAISSDRRTYIFVFGRRSASRCRRTHL